MVLVGCQAPASPPPGDSKNAEVEPNESFVSAQFVTYAVDGSAVLTGSVGASGDIDVFNLGAFAAGDTVRIAVTKQEGGLRSALALFDEESELIAEDTLTSVKSSAPPMIDHAVRADSSAVFVAISHTFTGPSFGSYEIAVDVTRGETAPAPVRQVVVLNFSGGTVVDPLLGEITVGPFDAADIAARYAGETETIKAGVIAVMKQNYARFDLVLLDPEVDELPADGAYSEVVFGGFNTFAFGAAQQVDPYNADPTDKAIVFTESFEPDLFQPILPSAEEMAVAIGNVAAHELGHLLGLNHVIDPTALMDESSASVTLLADQEFKSARLSDSIFPLGLQDAADLLFVTLGVNPEPAAKFLWLPAHGGVDLSATGGVLNGVNGVRRKCLTCMRRDALAGRSR